MVFKSASQRKAVMASLMRQKQAAGFVVRNIARPLALGATFRKRDREQIRRNAKRLDDKLQMEIKQLRKT